MCITFVCLGLIELRYVRAFSSIAFFTMSAMKVQETSNHAFKTLHDQRASLHLLEMKYFYNLFIEVYKKDDVKRNSYSSPYTLFQAFLIRC